MELSNTYKDNNVSAEEAHLIAQCIAQDRSAQRTLYNRYARKMFAVCYRYSKNREDAEDTLSEGFVRVFEKLDTYKGLGSFEGWIRRIMVNVAIEKFKKKKLEISDIDLEGSYSMALSSKEDIMGNMGAKELMGLVQQLPPAYQMVFNLYAFEGLKHKEIAEVLNISEGTSKSNLADARTRLKKGIEELSRVRVPKS